MVEIWRRTGLSERRGGYPRSWAGVRECWRDLVVASMPAIRPAMMLAVLGWGQPRIADEWRAYERGGR